MSDSKLVNKNREQNEGDQNSSNKTDSTRTHGVKKTYQAKNKGTIYLRFGPMYSGKTTWLNSELTQMADKGFSVLKIVNAKDVRYDVESEDKAGTTHNSSYKSLSPKIVCIRALLLSEIDVSPYHVIGIDEGQFFLDLVTTVEHWAEQEGKHLRISGLDGDFQRKRFGQILDLIPLADEAVKLSASCKICLDELERNGFQGNILTIAGPFTKRLGNSTEQEIIGGSDMYIPVCRYHHTNK